GDGRGDLVVGQGGGLKDGVYPAGYGGISIIAGAELAPSLTTFTKQFPALDVETVGGNKRNSRFGWALMVLDGDPADEFDQMDTLIIGAPGYKYGLIQERGRVHIMEAGSFNNF
ncbi:MAG: hypothetical protein OEZ59_07205, partial [Deltaproteobacteria bacterium]|nr:hypothetical protein [Deltaproteobacteria bacterium]